MPAECRYTSSIIVTLPERPHPSAASDLPQWQELRIPVSLTWKFWAWNTQTQVIRISEYSDENRSSARRNLPDFYKINLKLSVLPWVAWRRELEDMKLCKWKSEGTRKRNTWYVDPKKKMQRRNRQPRNKMRMDAEWFIDLAAIKQTNTARTIKRARECTIAMCSHLHMRRNSFVISIPLEWIGDDAVKIWR